jgi:hypothetical protein
MEGKPGDRENNQWKNYRESEDRYIGRYIRTKQNKWYGHVSK